MATFVNVPLPASLTRTLFMIEPFNTSEIHVQTKFFVYTVHLTMDIHAYLWLG